MSGRLRQAICDRISQAVKQQNVYHELEVPAKRLQSASQNPTLHWTPTAHREEDRQHLLQLIPTLHFDKQFVQGVRLLPAEDKQPAKLEFQLQPQAFAESLLQSDNATIVPVRNQYADDHVVVEFGSPNIAKPFHVGHLRSTIIGNMLGNLYRHFGYRVTKLNYLGDWGTQFGMLQVGVEMLNVSDEQIRRQPIETLYRAYVAANVASKSDASIVEKARRCFSELEAGSDLAMARQWQQYRSYTIDELKQVYGRLGVHYDQYDWESQYSQQHIGDILARLSSHSLLLREHDGRQVVDVDGRRVPIIKSDGSTLYLARDIAALADRLQRFNFKRILYVVENGQTDHFNACFKTAAALYTELTPTRLTHVKFGRIHGMSTRSGNVVFLRDVLDEARDIMLEKQLKSQTTKVELRPSSSDYKNVADVLGVSAVIINDLKQRRQRDYDFDWERALQVNGDTGVKLQYTHCRLHSLLANVAEIEVDGVRPDAEYLQEHEAQDLLYELARFEQATWLAKEQLEACILVNYLFGLCNATSRALKRLNVKNEPSRNKQQNRILLFGAAKTKLQQGMQILGLQPLNQM